jgi:hypothetical protein
MVPTRATKAKASATRLAPVKMGSRFPPLMGKMVLIPAVTDIVHRRDQAPWPTGETQADRDDLTDRIKVYSALQTVAATTRMMLTSISPQVPDDHRTVCLRHWECRWSRLHILHRAVALQEAAVVNRPEWQPQLAPSSSLFPIFRRTRQMRSNRSMMAFLNRISC